MFAAVPTEIENPRSLKTPIGSIEILATSEETQNSFAIIELSVPSQFPGAPLHYHEHMPESMYVLEGKIEVSINGQVRVLGAGELAVMPPKSVHGYHNPFEEQARFLIIAPGHDRFFLELIAWMKQSPVWPPKDRSELVSFGLRHDTIYV